MGQVPFPTSPRYGIIGGGRMARHFAEYLRLRGIPFQSWARNQAREGISLQNALGKCNVILLLVSDAAIVPMLQSESFLRRTWNIHFSGSLVTELATGFHPLMSFGSELYPLATYERMAFVSELGEPGFNVFFPQLANPSYAIPKELKPLYHSLCVLGGNLATLLWQKVFREMNEKLGLPREAVVPYLERIAANVSAAPETALTGPLQRRDYATLERNLQALQGDPYQDVYRSFVRVVLPDWESSNEMGREGK